VRTEHDATPPLPVAAKISMLMPVRGGRQSNQQADAIRRAIER
jgi:hypothetical protein